jgi:hypothetical protein
MATDQTTRPCPWCQTPKACLGDAPCDLSQVGPCAKRQVVCTITARDGQQFIGRNDCRRPQPNCPREPGEGYDKCGTVCQQIAHAEVVAVRLAENEGVCLHGAHAVLTGIDWICQHCRSVTAQAGIARIYVRNAPDVAA